MRGPFVVREAAPEDATAVLRLWSASDEDRKTAPPLPTNADVCVALGRLAADADERMLVAMSADEIVGVVHLRREPLTPIHSDACIRVAYLHVAASHRRRGVARTLMEAVVDWADEKSTEYVTAHAAASSREANRFLARLGMAQSTTVRTTATKSLRLKLASRDGSKVVSHNVLAARRLMRRRASRDSDRTDATPESSTQAPAGM